MTVGSDTVKLSLSPCCICVMQLHLFLHCVSG